MGSSRQDVGRITLSVVFIGILLIASFWILLPFLPAVFWATTIVLATWPIMLRLERLFGNRRAPAVVVMTLAILVVLIAPLWLAVSTIVTHMDVLSNFARTIISARLPPLPEWLSQIPLIGSGLAQTWDRLRSSGLTDLTRKLLPYAGSMTLWIGSTAGSVGTAFVQFLLTTLVAVMMYARGERAAARLKLFGRRLAGDRGETVVSLAGQAIRSVALGVVVTAFAQSIVGGIGLLLVGLPFPGLLTALMFMLCLIQLGPSLVLFPAVVWLYYSGEVVGGSVLLLFTIVATTVDQFVRPILIKRGADLPLLLIFSGVVGGLLAFGLLGLFIGPTILAVAYTLVNAWIDETSGSEHSPH